MANPFPTFLSFLDGLGGLEMLVIFVLALMLFGGKRLPEVAKGLGKSIREFKRAASGVEDEIRRAMDMDNTPHRRPPVRRPRSAVTTPKDTSAQAALPKPYEPPSEAAGAGVAAAVTSETPDDIAPEPPVDEDHDYGSEAEDHDYGTDEAPPKSDTPKSDPK